MKGMIAGLLLGGCLVATPAMASGEATGERLFKRLDSDHNGMVSEQEYVTSAEQRARRAFKRLDSNGDGQLSHQEYQEAIAKLKQIIEERRQQRQAPDNSNE